MGSTINRCIWQMGVGCSIELTAHGEYTNVPGSRVWDSPGRYHRLHDWREGCLSCFWVATTSARNGGYNRYRQFSIGNESRRLRSSSLSMAIEYTMTLSPRYLSGNLEKVSISEKSSCIISKFTNLGAIPFPAAFVHPEGIVKHGHW